ncbi:unnamed protein product [Orchesella dallaii]|uniref:CTP synthase n=1 Tax=Orchesella dallaii TaxID=48710 RepID=A0ABP1QF73_9HEXA
MKYVLVTGGVISGIGKGVIASSIGTILKCCGLRVTAIKIDPYINIDAGTFSPFEHGEVYVLDDGGEVDLDLGNYERFLDVTLHSDNNITTGKIYQSVIERERKGDYLGKTVQVVPHITDAIQDRVQTESLRPVTPDNLEPEVCIIEMGGTIGDIEGMPFVEAFRQFQFRVGRENFFCVHVSLVPQPKSTGEQKSKPTQASVRELRGLGLSPDLIVCRSENPVTESVKDKISNFCHVAPQQVISIHDCASIYRVPLLLKQQNVIDIFRDRLQLPIPNPVSRDLMIKWKGLAERHERLTEETTIALVGKYTQLEDAYASVTKALGHAALATCRKLMLKYIDAEDLEQETLNVNPVKYHEAWKILCGADGILVPGGFGKRGMEGKILAANWCRLNNKPYLGICLGFQAAVIEYARNVVGLKNANSTEMDSNTENPVVVDMPEHNPGKMGGTMRLGRRATVFKNEGVSILKQLYGNKDSVEERHRHRYEVNPQYINELEATGLIFVGKDDSGQRMEALEIPDKSFFTAVQFHPEYLSRPLRPSPPYVGLLAAASGQLDRFVSEAKSRSTNVTSGNMHDAPSDIENNDDLMAINELESELSDCSLFP